MASLEDQGYTWVGTIAKQFGAWHASIQWDDSEDCSAHASQASARRWVRHQVGAPLRYEQSPGYLQWGVFTKDDIEPEAEVSY